MRTTQFNFNSLWQTALAAPLALLVWILGILIGGGLFALYSDAPLILANDFSKVWLLSVAAWIGIWAAYHVCEWLFSAYNRLFVVLVFVTVSVMNTIAEIGHPIFWDVIARAAQGIVTSLTAYAFFCHETARR